MRHGDITAIYDPDTWHRILSTNTTGIISWFVYPPFTLFVLWPLGDATYNEAVLAWSLVPLAFYFALIVLLAKRSGLGAGTNPACENSWPRTQAYVVLIAFSLPFLSAICLADKRVRSLPCSFWGRRISGQRVLF